MLMVIQQRVAHWIVVAMMTVVVAEPVVAATPVLTGRWGDTRMPQQLVSNYESKKTRALVVVTFSTVCPLAKRLVPTLNQLQAKYFEQDVHFIALFPNGIDDLQAIAGYAIDTELAFPVFK
ncbi:MAG: hypothetical protein RID07_19480, partial [Lacipirellulaceae bacterium]